MIPNNLLRRESKGKIALILKANARRKRKQQVAQKVVKALFKKKSWKQIIFKLVWNM